MSAYWSNDRSIDLTNLTELADNARAAWDKIQATKSNTKKRHKWPFPKKSGNCVRCGLRRIKITSQFGRRTVEHFVYLHNGKECRRVPYGCGEREIDLSHLPNDLFEI